ncbi:hypothetical protein [Planomicrobium soli]|uniref:hypothetical protein n=1 Tax=Planomicrobium soli TaxID=1176648 RepID=UPI0015E79C11|nr:hypothetical protein [Planomicrobium soli]
MKKSNDGMRNTLISILRTICFFFIGLLIVSGFLYALVGLYDLITYLFYNLVND